MRTTPGSAVSEVDTAGCGDRAAQLRRAADRSRAGKRRAGLEPHEVWVTRQEWEARVKPLLADLAAARPPHEGAGCRDA